MVMHFSYTQLTRADVFFFQELMSVFGDAFEDAATYQGAVPSDAYLASLLDQNHFVALVAQNRDTNGGGLVAYVLDKFEQARREIYIYDLAVLEPYRRQGIATALIEALKEIAKEKGAYVIFVQADKGDDPAAQLYESLGVREDVLHFDISIDKRRD